MRAWSKVAPDGYLRLDLHAHALLSGVPLHDVWELALPGGGPGRSIGDVRALMSEESLVELNAAVRALFRLRAWLGSLFGWDSEERAPDVDSFRSRVPPELLERSTQPPGSREGPFVLLYELEREAVSEVRNATVHAFSVFALEPTATGYRMFWAIYVAPVGRVTRFYMALIDPFRRFLVYPAVLRRVHRAWCERFGSD